MKGTVYVNSTICVHTRGECVPLLQLENSVVLQEFQLLQID